MVRSSEASPWPTTSQPAPPRPEVPPLHREVEPLRSDVPPVGRDEVLHPAYKDGYPPKEQMPYHVHNREEG